MHRFDAYINGVSLSSVDPHIMLVDIMEERAQVDRELAARAMHPGQRMNAMVRRSLTVRLIVHITTPHIITRAEVMDKVAGWVGEGGWLTINIRPNQRLYVHAETSPAMGSSLRWTDEIEIELTAYERPYWEQQWPTVAVVTDSGTIIPTGTMPEAYVEVDVKNVGEGDLTTVTLSCGSTMIKLDGLTVPPQAYVRIYYTDDDLTCRSGGQILSPQTGDHAGSAGNDVYEKDDGDTVSDTVLVDSVCEPHNERCACDVANNDYNAVEPVCGTLALGCCRSKRRVSKKEVITNSGDYCEYHGSDSCDKSHLLLVGLAELAELGEYDTEKLNNDRCVNIR